jgi:hypothetical protein
LEQSETLNVPLVVPTREAGWHPYIKTANGFRIVDNKIEGLPRKRSLLIPTQNECFVHQFSAERHFPPRRSMIKAAFLPREEVREVE